jgi:hypothetical protein
MAAQHPTRDSGRVQYRYLIPVGPCFQGLAERRMVVIRVERTDQFAGASKPIRIPAKAWACGLMAVVTLIGGLIG